MRKFYFLAIIASVILFLSFSANPPQGSSGGPFDRTCARSGCHTGSGSAEGSILLEGIPGEVEPGKTYPFKVILQADSGSPQRGGMQLVATDEEGNDRGQISSPGSSSTVSSFQNRTYFEHQPAKSFSGDRVEYDAEWTAPASGSSTFYISALFANGNGSRTGDTYVDRNVTFSVGASNAFSASIEAIMDVLCHGESTGSAAVNASGGSGAFTYNWDNGETGIQASALNAGSHSVTVSDGQTETVLEFTISDPSPLETDISTISALECADTMDGSLTADVNGGSPPYTYVWSNGEETQQIENLGPGQYFVTIADDNGCTDVADISLFALDQEPPSITAIDDLNFALTSQNTMISIDNLDDFGVMTEDNCDNDVTLDWSPKSFDCGDVGINVLTITATDKSGNSNSVVVSVEIVDSESPTIDCIIESLEIATCASFTYTQPIVMDNCSDTRLELVSGIGINGNFPIGETIEVYRVTDVSGNSATCQITIMNDPQINVEADITPISCNGNNDGSVAFNVTGVNEPFTLEISEVNRTNNLASGTYTYLVTDFTGCMIEGSFVLEDPEDLTFNDTELTRPTNSNSGDGSINITVMGGSPPYNYTWMVEDEFFSDDEDLTQLFPGSYTVMVTDSRGCQLVSEVFVLEEVTSINDPELSQKISMFPIPADQFLHIQLKDLRTDKIAVTIYDQTGKMILENKLHPNIEDINTSTFKEGIYIIKLRIDDDYVVRSFFVVH